MDIQITRNTTDLQMGQATKQSPATRTSLGGIDEISPDDIIYGEYSDGDDSYGAWIELVYLGDDVLRTYSGPVSANHPVIEKLKLLLRDDKEFYVVAIREMARGFAFKHIDIVDIKVESTIEGNDSHAPSCVWMIHFRDGRVRTLETDYESYFAYGNTNRPDTMTNAMVLDKVFAGSDRAQ